MKVLLVDDDDKTREALGGFLRKEGWQVVEARDGEEAWDLHLRQKVHLVICDWVMPGVDGLELCRRVRRACSPAYTYFILATGARLAPDDVHVAMRAGADDVLRKPLDLVLVSLRLEAAQRVLGYANRLRELEGIIPICYGCRRLRDEKDCYQKMELYFRKHAGVLFSHGLCPECLEASCPSGAGKVSPKVREGGA